MNRAAIIEAVRTPRGRGKAGKGALSGVHPQELLAQTLNGLVAKARVPPSELDDVVVGCVSQVGEQGANIARNAVLAAGWPREVTGATVNRFCSSGLQAVAMAAFGVASGYQHVVVAGGVESMSRVPMGSDGAGQDGANEALRRRVFQVPQGLSADLIATREHISREQLDAFALASHQKAVRAMEEGRFVRSLVPVRSLGGAEVLLARDEGPRPDARMDRLAALPPSFLELGRQATSDGRTLDEIALHETSTPGPMAHLHTAGNSSPLTDGAASVLIASEAWAAAHGLRPRAFVRSVATVGTDPVLMLTGPAPASRKALAIAGLTPGDIDLWEINEAFAAVAIETIRTLGIDEERVNVNGGVIALGHPLGATGAMLLGMLVDELERRGGQLGVVTLCIGGGQGIAVVVERA